jgi:hypothetical protein
MKWGLKEEFGMGVVAPNAMGNPLDPSNAEVSAEVEKTQALKR